MVTLKTKTEDGFTITIDDRCDEVHGVIRVNSFEIFLMLDGLTGAIEQIKKAKKEEVSLDLHNALIFAEWEASIARDKIREIFGEIEEL